MWKTFNTFDVKTYDRKFRLLKVIKKCIIMKLDKIVINLFLTTQLIILKLNISVIKTRHYCTCTDLKNDNKYIVIIIICFKNNDHYILEYKFIDKIILQN